MMMIIKTRFHEMGLVKMGLLLVALLACAVCPAEAKKGVPKFRAVVHCKDVKMIIPIKDRTATVQSLIDTVSGRVAKNRNLKDLGLNVIALSVAGADLEEGDELGDILQV